MSDFGSPEWVAQAKREIVKKRCPRCQSQFGLQLMEGLRVHEEGAEGITQLAIECRLCGFGAWISEA